MTKTIIWRESEWTLGVGDGQGGLACCNSWDRKESDTTERLIWSDLIIFLSGCSLLYVHFKRKHVMLFEQDTFCNSLLGLLAWWWCSSFLCHCRFSAYCVNYWKGDIKVSMCNCTFDCFSSHFSQLFASWIWILYFQMNTYLRFACLLKGIISLIIMWYFALSLIILLVMNFSFLC